MANSIIHFEYPLNEKMRSWLRLEYLLNQLVNQHEQANQGNYLYFLRSFSELLDIFERSELRADIIKELERHQQKLQQWLPVPEVNHQLIHQLTGRLQESATHLVNSPRFGQPYKEDRFLAQVRQRISIPGGYCSFDIPTLHLWLQLPKQQQEQQVTQWITPLRPLFDSLTLIMDLTRQSGHFRACTSHKGFYQDTTSEHTDLLRIRLKIEDQIYPQISGHKNRYAIRFMSLENSDYPVPDELCFELACC